MDIVEFVEGCRLQRNPLLRHQGSDDYGASIGSQASHHSAPDFRELSSDSSARLPKNEPSLSAESDKEESLVELLSVGENHTGGHRRRQDQGSQTRKGVQANVRIEEDIVGSVRRNQRRDSKQHASLACSIVVVSHNNDLHRHETDCVESNAVTVDTELKSGGGYCGCPTYDCPHSRSFPFRPVPCEEIAVGAIIHDSSIALNPLASTLTSAVHNEVVAPATDTTMSGKYSGCSSSFAALVEKETSRVWRIDVISQSEASVLRWVALSCLGRQFGTKRRQTNSTEQADEDAPSIESSQSTTRGSPPRHSATMRDQVLPRISLCTLVMISLLTTAMAIEGVFLASSVASQSWVSAELKDGAIAVVNGTYTNQVPSSASHIVNTTFFNATTIPDAKLEFGLFRICRGSHCGKTDARLVLERSYCTNLLPIYASLSTAQQRELLQPTVLSQGLLFIIAVGLGILLLSILASCGTIFKLSSSRAALKSMEEDPLNTLITYEQKRLLPHFTASMKVLKTENEVELLESGVNVEDLRRGRCPKGPILQCRSDRVVNLQNVSLNGFVFPFAAMARPTAFSYDPLDAFEPPLDGADQPPPSAVLNNSSTCDASKVAAVPTLGNTIVPSLNIKTQSIVVGEASVEARLCAGVAVRVNHYLERFVGRRHPFMVRSVLFALPLSSTLILGCAALSLLTFFTVQRNATSAIHDVTGGVQPSSSCIESEALLRSQAPTLSACQLIAMAFPYDSYTCAFDTGSYFLFIGTGASFLVFIASALFGLSVAGDLWAIYHALDVPTLWWSAVVNDQLSPPRFKTSSSAAAAEGPAAVDVLLLRKPNNNTVVEKSGQPQPAKAHIGGSSLRLPHLHRGGMAQFLHPCACHLHSREVLIAERRRHEAFLRSTSVSVAPATAGETDGMSALERQAGYARMAVIYGLFRIALALNPAKAAFAVAANHERLRRMGDMMYASPVPLSLCTGCGGLDVLRSADDQTKGELTSGQPTQSLKANPLDFDARGRSSLGSDSSEGALIPTTAPTSVYRLTSQGSLVKGTHPGIHADANKNGDGAIARYPPFLRVPNVVTIPAFVFSAASVNGGGVASVDSHNPQTATSNPGIPTQPKRRGGRSSRLITLPGDELVDGVAPSPSNVTVSPMSGNPSPSTAPHRQFTIRANESFASATTPPTTKNASHHRRRSVAFSQRPEDKLVIDGVAPSLEAARQPILTSEHWGVLPVLPMTHEEVIQAINASTSAPVGNHQLSNRSAITARAEQQQTSPAAVLPSSRKARLSQTSFGGSSSKSADNRRGHRRFSLMKTATANNWVGGSGGAPERVGSLIVNEGSPGVSPVGGHVAAFPSPITHSGVEADVFGGPSPRMHEGGGGGALIRSHSSSAVLSRKSTLASISGFMRGSVFATSTQQAPMSTGHVASQQGRNQGSSTTSTRDDGAHDESHSGSDGDSLSNVESIEITEEV